MCRELFLGWLAQLNIVMFLAPIMHYLYIRGDSDDRKAFNTRVPEIEI